MTAQSQTTNHFKGVDGLRAIAVLSIIAFHIDSSWLPGGFVGVDIFFVISGFVVANSVINKRFDHFFDYVLWFYRRRFLRILPALVAFVLITLVLSAFFIPLSRTSEYYEITGTSSLFGLSNVALWKRAGSYFEPNSALNPFTHMWSLAVEEQYYFLFPLFSYFLLIKPTFIRRLIPVTFVISTVALSFAYCAYATTHAPAAAFYLIMSRFWELGLGFLLCCGLTFWRTPRVTPRGDIGIGIIFGVSLIVLMCALYLSNKNRFPFPWVILPCVATAGLIVATVLRPKSRLSSWLANPFFLFVGKISYSLYLWHWGILVLMRWTVGADTPWLQAVAIVLMTAGALGSYYLIEKPIRYAPIMMRLPNWRFYWPLAAIMLIAGLFGGGVYAAKRSPWTPTGAARQVWDPYAMPKLAAGECRIDVKESFFSAGHLHVITPQSCKLSNDAKTIYVFGDSHAEAYKRMMILLAAREGYVVRLYELGGCHYFDHPIHFEVPGCDDFRAATMAEIFANIRSGDSLFLPGLHIRKFRETWDSPISPVKSEELRVQPIDHERANAYFNRLKPLIERGATIILEAPEPILRADPYRCSAWFNRASQYCRENTGTPRAEILRRRERALEFFVDLDQQSSSILLWDPFDLLCPGTTCDIYRAGKPLYWDSDHLSAYGNDLLYPSFVQELTKTQKKDGL